MAPSCSASSWLFITPAYYCMRVSFDLVIVCLRKHRTFHLMEFCAGGHYNWILSLAYHFVISSERPIAAARRHGHYLSSLDCPLLASGVAFIGAFFGIQLWCSDRQISSILHVWCWCGLNIHAPTR